MDYVAERRCPEGRQDEPFGALAFRERAGRAQIEYPAEQPVQQSEAYDADAGRQLQRIVVHVVGNRQVAGVLDVRERLGVREDQAERVGAESEYGPLLDGADGRAPDLEAGERA